MTIHKSTQFVTNLEALLAQSQSSHVQLSHQPGSLHQVEGWVAEEVRWRVEEDVQMSVVT